MQDVCGSKDAWVVASRPTMEQNSLMEAGFELAAYAADASGNSMTDGQIREIVALCEREKERLSYYEFARRQIREAMRVIDTHLRSYGSGGINSILRTNDERLGYWFQCAVGDKTSYPIFPLDPENVYPPGRNVSPADDGINHGATWNDGANKMSRWEWTGGAELYTAGTDIDTALYGKSVLTLYCEAGSGAAVTFDVTAKLIDDTTEVKSVSLTLNAGNYNGIGTTSDKYIGVTDITKTIGSPANGDICTVRSVLERFTKIT